MNPLLQLINHGQSYWLDNLTREMIEGGDLERRVQEEGLRGITSNPSIFHKAITGGKAYDSQIRELARAGLGADGIYERLVVQDIQSACDILRPVFDESHGEDGFVSLEVSPYLVHDTAATMDEARRLFHEVDRPNVFIKIPGSPAGTPAIEQMLYEGVNVNITLLFSIDAYEAVAEAYLSALERRADEGKPLDSVASVASFFLSRIDVLVDHLLGQRIRPGRTGTEALRPERLLGEAAVANAKMAYQSFKALFDGDRWVRLATRGARKQRVLWASTSTKNPLYSDVRYVEPLIGPHTVNTLPDRTIAAFSDHGRVRPGSVEEGLHHAQEVLEGLGALGIDFDSVTWQLLNEGMEKFTAPYDKLMRTLQAQRQEALGRAAGGPQLTGIDLADGLQGLDEERFGPRLHARDPWLWAKGEPEERAGEDGPGAGGGPGTEGESDEEKRPSPATVAKAVGRRLGWLDCVDIFSERVHEVTSFAEEVKSGGVARVVLLGMGGSSLCPAASSSVFGAAEGWPSLVVLDSTDPGAIRAATEGVDFKRLLFVVSSKSGSTKETISFFRHFHERARQAFGESAGNRFVAITDAGSPLAALAEEHEFQRVFANPEDIGGRYSALSFFGLVPMALQGIDVAELLGRARTQLVSCSGEVPSESNPGVHLGAALALAGRSGRDKVTMVLDEALAPFGWWLEQLLAESTGKDGKGLLPVEGERLGEPPTYGKDRLFVSLELAQSPGSGLREEALEALEGAGHPVIRIVLDDVYDLGAEFLRWEIATATAGAVLGVNPFDEPNVAESKENARNLLDKWAAAGRISEPDPSLTSGETSVWLGEKAAILEPGQGNLRPTTPADAVRLLLESLRPGDYVALLPYLARSPERQSTLQQLRERIRARHGVATTLGYGPRYLHSTGQLHKGGPATGVYLMITADSGEDIPVPGEGVGFGTLLRAQALGDFEALDRRERRILRLHLGANPDRALAHLLAELFPEHA